MKRNRGFTIVELLIVIVVIGILAAIVIVAYRGMQERAATSSAESTVAQVGKKIKMHSVTNGSYPANLSEIGVSESGDTTYDYAATADGFCFSAEVKGVARSINQLQNISSGSCQFALVKWSSSGGISIDTAANQIQLNPSQVGESVSPLIHNNGASSVRLSAEVYVTQPSVNSNPRSAAHFSSAYYGADKSTPVTNTSGHTGNGFAGCNLVVNQWTNCSWNTATGPNVHWMRFVIRSSPSNYTSDNLYRNIQITVNN